MKIFSLITGVIQVMLGLSPIIFSAPPRCSAILLGLYLIGLPYLLLRDSFVYRKAGTSLEQRYRRVAGTARVVSGLLLILAAPVFFLSLYLIYLGVRDSWGAVLILWDSLSAFLWLLTGIVLYRAAFGYFSASKLENVTSANSVDPNPRATQ